MQPIVTSQSSLIDEKINIEAGGKPLPVNVLKVKSMKYRYN
jgi:hypothetical protein